MGLVRLQKMAIENCPMMKKIVVNEEGETTTNTISLPHLSVLCFRDLPNLTTFYSEDEEMCSNENIHIVIQPLFNDKVNLPVLKMLEFWNLDSIKSIWHNHPNKQDSFCNLCEVYVGKCESLKCVFPAYVAQRLHQLEKLRISDCSGVETIVEDEGDENKEVSPTFTFPKLTCLNLLRLPNVECFYPKKDASEWPLLNELEVKECDKISILELLHFSGNQQHNQFQKVLSKLEVLSIRGKDMTMMMMMLRQYSELFLKLRWLTLTEFDDGDESSTVFPSNFLYGLHNLKRLYIEKSSFEEIFPYEGEGEGLLLPLLRRLKLENMAELKYICTENSPFFPILHKLTHLEIIGCPGLTNLLQTPSLSFKFLRDLTVTDCSGLINIIPSSAAAASLKNLRYLTIRGCEMIEEIVAADHHSLSLSHSQPQQDHEILITFSKLRQLALAELPRLTSFCTANNYTFNFPQLDYVDVRECPNMRTFSPGITITPRLRAVATGWSIQWKGDLNTTIQHMFSEREAQRLTTTDPSTSSNNHVEPEAQSHEKPTESTGKEAEEICEDGVGEVGKKAEISENVIKPENEIEPRNGTDICEEVAEEGKVAHSSDKGKGKQLEICEEKMRFNQHGESSLSDPSSRSLANEPEEQTNAESLAPQHAVASSSQLSPTSDHLETSPSLVASASSSQQKDVEGLRVTKHFIPLLSNVLQILQTQPLSSMSAEQVQFMEDASRDLSGMNFPMEWLCPYLDKARKCLSVVERTKAISELELKIVEIEAQVQALAENKKALSETKKALEEENEAIASGMDLNKPLYDD